MMDESSSRTKRQKIDKTGRLAALQKLKELKGKSVKHKYNIEEVEDVYEEIDEKEYVKRVLDRQDDWIVDGDGSGYVEDGRDIFDDDLDAESIASASAKKNKGKKRKKDVSENAGKGNLQFMLSNMPSKKKEETKLDDDEILSELISELNESPSTSSASASNVFEEKRAVKNYMKSFSMPKPNLTPIKLNKKKYKLKETTKIKQETHINSSNVEVEIEQLLELNMEDKESFHEEIKPESEKIEESTQQSECFDDDYDMSQIDFESPIKKEQNNFEEEITEEQLLKGWETMQEGTTNAAQIDVEIDSSKLPLTVNEEGKKVFRFFLWDVYENQAVKPGLVFLFGKTYCEAVQSYVSCCVGVGNIYRKMYLLPRTHYLDFNGQPTEKLVTLMDVYREFNDIAGKMDIKVYKSKKVMKKYAFDPTIPTESEYLEVRYDAKYPALYSNAEGKTFSKVFGASSKCLDICLLDNKIKGPCWLDVENPICVTSPWSWCKFDLTCTTISVTKSSKILHPPPLTVACINMKIVPHLKNLNNEIVMISCLVHKKYEVDKPAPNPPFEQHFCILRPPSEQTLPSDFIKSLQSYKATKVQKTDSETALLNFFLNQITQIDPDLIVGHDLNDYQLQVLCDRASNCTHNFNRLGRLRRKTVQNKHNRQREITVGRLVCDMKLSAKELIKCKSYDLDTLCQTVLKVSDNQRMEIESLDVLKMFQNSSDIFKMISLTMQDTAFILKMMYELNVMPLALQITNIAGNIMHKTLLGGRSERNEFLLLHAFLEKDYIVPDKITKTKYYSETTKPSTSKKKAAYAGGLVLEPKVGFYDKLILLMDFNSLYPSIIQEYNICFTTITSGKGNSPDSSLPQGILPTEIRKLVESRREVKKLMNNSDISNERKMQYNIRQMALKLTANSMYGCLGFSNSRFYAKELAALVTQKGREILMNTKDLVQKLNFEVIYGDTDSIMINTNSLDYDQVIKTGHKIKQEVNKLYKQVELDVDGVFKYLLLLKKKKYAAVTLTKSKNGELKMEQEHKGLDIVRRDWSQLAAEAGKFILNHLLSDQPQEEKIQNIQNHLMKLKDDLIQGRIPLPLLVITKQLTKEPRLYADKKSLPHVQVALRFNQKNGKSIRVGDTVPYIICDDGTTLSATQRAYHIEELKNSNTLKIDCTYYLAHQIHPVISRLCEPIEGIDAYQVAVWLDLDPSAFKVTRNHSQNNMIGENFRRPEVKFRNVSPFVFKCVSCKTENKVTSSLINGVPFLEKCANTECDLRPVEYLSSIQNKLVLTIREFISKYYRNELTCEDPACTYQTVRLPMKFASKYPICGGCKKGVMYKKVTEGDLYMQLLYFQYLFDIAKLDKKLLMDDNIKSGFSALKDTIDKFLKHSGYLVINLKELFSYVVPNPNLIEEDDSADEGYYNEPNESEFAFESF